MWKILQRNCFSRGIGGNKREGEIFNEAIAQMDKIQSVSPLWQKV